MNKFMKMLGVSALTAVVIWSSCKDEDQAPVCKDGTFKMTLNSDLVTGSSFNNTLLKANSGGVAAKRMDIRATDADGRQLIISFNDLTTGTTGDGVSTGDYIPFIDVTTGTENTFFFTIIENSVSNSFIEGTLDITSCDASARKISGTFSFSDGDYEVTNGSFTDMCYTVIQ